MRDISRRKLLKAPGWTAGGIIVFGGAGSALAFPAFPHRGAPTAEDAAAWLSLRPDGTIEVYSPRAEIGQGIAVALRQIVAEETGVALDLVRCIAPDTGLINPARATVGSDSIKDYGPLLAQAAALAAAMRARAATLLGVAAASLTLAEAGFQAASGTRVAFSRLAEGKPLIIDEEAVAAARPQALQPGKAHTIVGKPQPSDGIKALVTAAARDNVHTLISADRLDAIMGFTRDWDPADEGRIEEHEGFFVAPSLRGLWARPQDFLHHGRAVSLREVVATPDHPALRPRTLNRRDPDRPVGWERGLNELDGLIDTHGTTSHLSAWELECLLMYLVSIE